MNSRTVLTTKAKTLRSPQSNIMWEAIGALLGIVGFLLKAFLEKRKVDREDPGVQYEKEVLEAINEREKFEKAVARGDVEYINEVIKRNRVTVPPSEHSGSNGV